VASRSRLCARAQNLQSVLHAVERVPSKEQAQPARSIPIRFIFSNKLTIQDKLLVAFDALILSEMLDSEVLYGKVIHGDDHIALRVKTSASASEVRKLAGKIAALLSTPSAPDLILNRHCAECEFHADVGRRRWRKTTSLVVRHDRKGTRQASKQGHIHGQPVFLHVQAKKDAQASKEPARPHYLALQALSIRENTIHLHGDPRFQIQGPESISTLRDCLIVILLSHWCFGSFGRV